MDITKNTYSAAEIVEILRERADVGKIVKHNRKSVDVEVTLPNFTGTVRIPNGYADEVIENVA